MDSINVLLNLTADNKTLRQKVDAPCSGLTAKAIGKYKFEDQFGLTVKFKSYQEGSDKPEQPLPDDAKVLTGSILNFATDLVLSERTLANHTKMLKITLAPLVLDLTARFTSRLSKPAETEVAEKTGCRTYLAAHPENAAPIAAVLTATQGNWTCADFAKELDDSFAQRCGLPHINTNEVLERQLEAMRSSGAVDLLQNEYPLECHIITHYETFMQLVR